MPLPPSAIRSATKPANPASGGHYVQIQPNVWQQIHAVGPGKWAPGAPSKAAAKVATPKAQPAANPYSNPLYNPAATLSGKPLYQAAQAATNIKYDPQIAALKQQIAQNTQQGAAAQQQTAGYFNQLGQYGQQAAQDVQGNAAALNSQLGQIGQGTQSAISSLAQKAAAPALQSLEAQGLGAGGSQFLASALAAAQSRAAQNSAIDQAYGAKVGANAANLSAQSLGAYALGGQERLGQIAQATRLAQQPIETNLATAQTDKASTLASNVQALRQQQVNNLMAQQGLGIKQQAITSTAQTAAANRATSTANNVRSTTTSRANNAASNATSQANTAANIKSREGVAAANRAAKAGAGATGSKGSLTLAQNNSYWKQVALGIAAVGVGKQQGKSNSQINAELLQKLNPLQAQAAMELWIYHYLNPSTAQQLHTAGVRGGSYAGKPIQVGAPKSPYTTAQLQQVQTGIANAVSKLK